MENDAHGSAGTRAKPAGLAELGFDDAAAEIPTPLPARTKLAAWGLGTAGIVAFVALAAGAIVVVNWAIPYLRYLYLVMLGA